MTAAAPGVDHRVAELSGIVPGALADPSALSGMVVAAASAMGVSAGHPPLVRRGPHGSSVALVCLDGHVVLHTRPDAGHCFVDAAVRAPGQAGRAIDVIARRLGASLT